MSTAKFDTWKDAAGTNEFYKCRAWANWDGSGTVAIRASGNVTSITDNGTGDYTVNFTNAMPDADYSFTFGALASGFSDPVIWGKTAIAPTTSALRVFTGNSSTGAVADIGYLCVSIFR